MKLFGSHRPIVALRRHAVNATTLVRQRRSLAAFAIEENAVGVIRPPHRKVGLAPACLRIHQNLLWAIHTESGKRLFLTGFH
jgi:hypothetical protein